MLKQSCLSVCRLIAANRCLASEWSESYKRFINEPSEKGAVQWQKVQ